MKAARLVAGFVLAGIVSAATLHAQDLGTPRKLWWLNIGAGFSSGVEPGLPGIGLGLSYKHNPGLFSLRTAYFEEFQICLFGGCVNPDRAWDAGALYGVITKSRTTFASASAGIGLAGGRRGGEKSFTTVGIPLETQLFVTPFRHANVGFGLYGLGDINPKKSFWGALFCLQVGRLK